MFPFDSRVIAIDGHTVHYVDEGSGPTLLFLHGNPTWSLVYRDVIHALRGEFRCVALDYPGFGLSSPRPGYRCLPEEHTQAVAAFVDALAGDADIAFRGKERRRWEQLFGDHRTVIVEGAGHFVQSDAPDRYVAAIRDWHTPPISGDAVRETPAGS